MAPTKKKAAVRKKSTERVKTKTKTESRTNKANGVPARRGRKPRANEDLAPKRLRGNLFLEYRAAQAELMEAKAKLDLAENLLRAEIKKTVYQPLLQLQGRRNEELNTVVKAQELFKAVQAKVAAKFDIDVNVLSHYTINQFSGMIVFTPPKEGGPAQAQT